VVFITLYSLVHAHHLFIRISFILVYKRSLWANGTWHVTVVTGVVVDNNALALAGAVLVAEKNVGHRMQIYDWSCS